MQLKCRHVTQKLIEIAGACPGVGVLLPATTMRVTGEVSNRFSLHANEKYRPAEFASAASHRDDFALPFAYDLVCASAKAALASLCFAQRTDSCMGICMHKSAE